MRIAVFIKSTTFNKGFGGQETQNKLLVEGLAGAKHSVVVVAPAPTAVPKQASLGGDTGYWILDTKYLKYVFIDAPSGKYSKQWFRESLKVFRKLHRESPFDVIISQSMAGRAIVAQKGRQGKESGKESDSLLCKESDSGKPDSFPRQVSRSVPVVVIQHGTILGELKTRWRAMFSGMCHFEGASATEESRHCSFKEILRCAQNDRKLNQLLFFFLRLVPYGIKIYVLDQLRLRRADAVIAVSDQVRDALLREYFLPPEKITVVYNGVEIEKYEIPRDRPARFESRSESGGDTEIRKELGIDEKSKVILYVGRIEKEKGLRVLLESFQRTVKLPNCQTAQLFIVGDGLYLADLKGLAKRLGIEDRVRSAGRVPYKDVPKYYAAADVFVLPSLREEGLPMTLPEAMAAGLPVVASRIGGIPTAVKDGETGILVKPGSVEELSIAISKLAADGEWRSKMGRQARRVVEEKFSQESMVGGALRVIFDLL